MDCRRRSRYSGRTNLAVFISSFTYVLLVSCSVGILVLLRGEEVHVGDLVEERFVQLRNGSSLGVGSESLDGSDNHEGEENGVSLHDFLVILIQFLKKL